MTKEEIAEKINSNPEDVEDILNELIKKEKIIKQEENYKVFESPFGIFAQKEYQVLLDYIMANGRFSKGKIKSKFPEEFSKLPKLLECMGDKYVKQEKDAIDHYVVHTKGRILYFVMKNENVTFPVIKKNFPLISSQEISNSINIAIRNKELEKSKIGTFKVLQM